MAKSEHRLQGEFYSTVKRISDGVINGSISATLEGSSDFRRGDALCSVRVFERYSCFGGNRVSLSLTFFKAGDGPIELSAIATGGSRAVLFKLDTVGEEAFLEKLHELL